VTAIGNLDVSSSNERNALNNGNCENDDGLLKGSN